MNHIFWQIIAWIVTRSVIKNWLIKRAMRTPYAHIKAPDTDDIYMFRFWLFNPYQFSDWRYNKKHIKWLPSIRIHFIMRADKDRHLHNHPWAARTIILDGWYAELREIDEAGVKNADFIELSREGESYAGFYRKTGDTDTLKCDTYHRISSVSNGGVTTLFFTYAKQETWGFKVDGKQVPWREHLGVK